MCLQYLCFICDRPLTGHEDFVNCHSNPEAKPPWLEIWKPTPQCSRPIYCYSGICHVQCNETRLRTRTEIERQLGIQAVIGRSDGLLDWYRSHHAVQSLTIPQVKVLCLPEWPPNTRPSLSEPAHEMMTPTTQMSQEAGNQIQQALPSLHTQGLISFVKAENDNSPQHYVTTQIQQGLWAGSSPSAWDRGPQAPNESNLPFPSSRISTPNGKPSHVTGSGAITEEGHSKPRESWQLDLRANTGPQEYHPTPAAVQYSYPMLPAHQAAPYMPSITPDMLPMPAAERRVPVTSVAPSFPEPTKRFMDKACNRCRDKHVKCIKTLPSCSRCTDSLVPCIYPIDATESAFATLSRLDGSRGTRLDFRDTGVESGGYERLPSLSTFMSDGRTSMDYPLDGSYPVDSQYGQGRTPSLRSHMNNEHSQESPFATSSTPSYTASHGAYVPETYGFRDRTAAAFDGNLGGTSAEGHENMALDPRLRSSGEQIGQKKRKIHRINE